MKKKKTRLRHDGKEVWLVVDKETGKVVDKYRNKNTAMERIKKGKFFRWAEPEYELQFNGD